MESKKILLALAIKHKGNWDDICNDIAKNKDFDESFVEETANQYKGKFITIMDDEYPEQLKQGIKPPFVLFYEGNITLLKDTNYRRLALNDSRHTTTDDKKVADKLMTDLPDDVAFVIGGNSELSYDIAIKNKRPTIVVLSHSLDLINDNGRKDQIIKQGGVYVSEYPVETEITKDSVMIRYRIMSSLCDKMLVVSHIKRNSGTKFLIGLVLSQGKDVMVVPTSPLDEEESANNELIAEGAYPVYDNESLCYNI